MTRPRLIRCLRIAVSAVCVTVSVLLAGLWVRTYWYADTFFITDGALVSAQGSIFFVYEKHSPHPYWNWGAVSQPLDDWQKSHGRESQGILGGGFAPIRRGWIISIPTGYLLLLSAALAFVPWLPWSTRFSLRTLLLVTTFVALALGCATLWWTK